MLMPSRSAPRFPLGASCLSFTSVKSIGLWRCKIPRGKIKSDPNPNPRGLVRNMIFTWQVSKIWFQSSDFLFKKKMPLFDIRSDRQIIALAIKAFKIRNERRNYLKKKKNPARLAFEGICMYMLHCLSSPQI